MAEQKKTARKGTRAVAATAPTATVAEMVESIVGCKWSLTVLALVQGGTTRPGAMTRSTPGLTTKVLNERLAKMLRFGILDRTLYPEVSPRVEYRLTSFGRRFTGILDAIDTLQNAVDRPVPARPAGATAARTRLKGR